jgi:hypothetical protein
MSTGQMNAVITIGEIVLLLLLILCSAVAVWARNRENARDISQSPQVPQKLTDHEGPSTKADAQLAGLLTESANSQLIQISAENNSAKERAQAVTA